MYRILTVIGARPNFIKAAVVSKALKNIPNLTETVVHTKQHHTPSMTDAIVKDLGMEYPILLNEPFATTAAERLGNMVYFLGHHISNLHYEGQSFPDYVMVYGDTDSALVGALVARKYGIPIIHVEAGLRSYNPLMQEESNRIMIDHISDVLFAPTAAAMRNLEIEHLKGAHLVGDVMYDASMQYAADETIIKTLKLNYKGYYLATLHRAETVDDEDLLRVVVNALTALAKHMPVVLPIHPRTRERMNKFGLVFEGIMVLPPQSYTSMQALEKNSALILTDSGGVQKEAYFHQVPCVTLRRETEWSELVAAGWNHLLHKVSEDAILSAVAEPFARMSISDYGDGHASEKIAAIIGKLLTK